MDRRADDVELFPDLRRQFSQLGKGDLQAFDAHIQSDPVKRVDDQRDAVLFAGRQDPLHEDAVGIFHDVLLAKDDSLRFQRRHDAHLVLKGPVAQVAIGDADDILKVLHNGPSCSMYSFTFIVEKTWCLVKYRNGKICTVPRISLTQNKCSN